MAVGGEWNDPDHGLREDESEPEMSSGVGVNVPWDRETARAYADVGPHHHIAILRGIVPDLLGDLNGARVLDFGCGPGRLSVALAEAGAAQVMAVDESQEMIDRARIVAARQKPSVRRRIEIRKGNEVNLQLDAAFDAALSSLALMMCDSSRRLQMTCRTLAGALRPGGRLLVVITHPCFRGRDYDTFRYELPEDYDYWRSGTAYKVALTAPAGGEGTTKIIDYHWTLGDYCNALFDGGVVLTRVKELPAAYRETGAPDGPPAYLVMRFDRPGG